MTTATFERDTASRLRLPARAVAIHRQGMAKDLVSANIRQYLGRVYEQTGSEHSRGSISALVEIWKRLVPVATSTETELDTVTLSAMPGVLDSSYRRLAELAGLPPDWDSYGAMSVSRQTIHEAERLLMDLQSELAQRYYESIRPFFVAPLANGGISFEWQRGQNSLEIEITPGGTCEYLARASDGSMTEGLLANRRDALRLVADILNT